MPYFGTRMYKCTLESYPESLANQSLNYEEDKPKTIDDYFRTYSNGNEFSRVRGSLSTIAATMARGLLSAGNKRRSSAFHQIGTLARATSCT